MFLFYMSFVTLDQNKYSYKLKKHVNMKKGINLMSQNNPQIIKEKKNTKIKAI